jgi:hypothetical protein
VLARELTLIIAKAIFTSTTRQRVNFFGRFTRWRVVLVFKQFSDTAILAASCPLTRGTSGVEIGGSSSDPSAG